MHRALSLFHQSTRFLKKKPCFFFSQNIVVAPKPAPAAAPSKPAAAPKKAESPAPKKAEKKAEAPKKTESPAPVEEEIDDEITADLFGKEHLNVVFMGHVGELKKGRMH
jgi:peptide chain release factor subunit 3